MGHGPEHGWLHVADQLPADLIYEADLAFGKQQDVYIISGANGSDATGDGSPDKPFEHTSAAITAGKAAAKSVIAISIDHTVAYELLSIPGTADSVDYVYITATEPFYTYTDNFDFVLEQGSHLMLNNVWANQVKEAVAITAADLTMEEGAIDNFVDSTGTGNPVNTDAHIFGAYIGSGVIVRLNGAKSFEGWAVNQAAEKGIVCINPMNMNSKKIINVADGTVASDGMAFGQKYVPTFGTGAGEECEGNDARLLLIMKSDIPLGDVAPVYADLTGAGWVNGDRGMGVGTGGRIFLMSRYSDALKYVELS